jgi:hypothetical protein
LRSIIIEDRDAQKLAAELGIVIEEDTINV